MVSLSVRTKFTPFVETKGVWRRHMVLLSVRTKFAPFVTGCVWRCHMVSLSLRTKYAPFVSCDRLCLETSYGLTLC